MIVFPMFEQLSKFGIVGENECWKKQKGRHKLYAILKSTKRKVWSIEGIFIRIIFTLPFFILFDLLLYGNALQQSKEVDKIYQIMKFYQKVEYDRVLEDL